MDDFVALIAGLDGLSMIIGVIGGFVCAVLVSRLNRRSVLDHVAEHLSDKVENTFENVTETIKTSSSEALKDNQAQFFSVANDKLADQRQLHSSQLESKKALIDTQLQQQSKEHNKELANKKELIDQRLTNMDDKLGKVERLVQELQTDRKAQYSALDEQLKSLTSTTTSLQTALADNRVRGEWGERIVDIILEHLGFTEGINFEKKLTTADNKKPDFTFRLPNQLILNMDVKFPLTNYTRYRSAESKADKLSFSEAFKKDVHERVKEIRGRDYINAETVNCVLIFIPNEQVFRFIHEQDDNIIDFALSQKVILCSPVTLYAVLAVIWQAAQNFNIERRSREIVAVVNEVRNQWGEYTKEMTTLGNHINRANNKFEELLGVRTRELDRRFNNIDGLLENNELQSKPPTQPQQQLPDEAKTAVDDIPF